MIYEIVSALTGHVIYTTDSEVHANEQLYLLGAECDCYLRCKSNSFNSRRNTDNLLWSAERTIKKAVKQIEELGDSIGLTDAINHLHKARELVADFIDNK